MRTKRTKVKEESQHGDVGLEVCAMSARSAGNVHKSKLQTNSKSVVLKMTLIIHILDLLT